MYQHYNKLFIAGTKDFPQDHVDDLKLPSDDISNKTERGGYADRSHHGIDTVIRHSLGGSVSLALGKQCKKEGNNPYVMFHSKAYGAPPVVSGNLGSALGKVGKSIINNYILYFCVAGGAIAGGAIDSAIGFSDGGILTGMGADIGKKISTDMANILTEDNDTSPDRIRYVGDPIRAMGFIAKAVFPSLNSDGIIVRIVSLVFYSGCSACP